MACPGSDDPRKDWFGTSLELGDIDRNGYADLVVGAPGENKGRGQVTVIRALRSGWKTSGNYSYSQNTKGSGKAERGDWFGWSLTLLDHNRDGRLDLSIGTPLENKSSGMITTLPGSGKKFSTGKSHTFGLKSLGYRYPAQARFGLESRSLTRDLLGRQLAFREREAIPVGSWVRTSGPLPCQGKSARGRGQVDRTCADLSGSTAPRLRLLAHTCPALQKPGSARSSAPGMAG